MTWFRKLIGQGASLTYAITGASRVNDRVMVEELLKIKTLSK